MNTSFFIAKRYLFSKKSVNAINVISGISMLGVFVGSAALIIILSVFNGFEKVVLSMYDSFTPALKIEPANGKYFDPDSVGFNELKKDKSVAALTEVLQEKVLLRYGTGQYIATLKGVSGEYTRGKELDTTLVSGKFSLRFNGGDAAIIGSAVQAYLSINVFDEMQYIQVYSPRKGAEQSINPADGFISKSIHAGGVFEVQQQFNELVVVPIGFARELLEENNSVSSFEMDLQPGTNVRRFRNELQEKLGEQFLVKDKIQQNQLLYKVLNSEKWAVFLILTFVLIIAIFNIIGSLTMLVIDKRKDIAILSSLGAGRGLIRRIFFTEGLLISFMGCVAGILVGLIFCLLQQEYGMIKMDEDNLITESYPIDLKWTDFILVFSTVAVVSVIASAISSRLSVKQIDKLSQQE